MTLKEMAIGRSDLLKINPAIIEVDETYNVRVFNPVADIEDASLLSQIREQGVKDPLVVRQDGEVVYVVQGHRRLAAVKMLMAEGMEIVSVPCLPEDKKASEADRDLDLLTSNSGKPLTWVEQAAVVKRLVAHGWDHARIARNAGFSVPHILNMLDLSAAPKEVLQQVAAGTVSQSTAVKTVRTVGKKAAAEVIKKAAATNKKGKATPAAVAKVAPKPKKEPKYPGVDVTAGDPQLPLNAVDAAEAALQAPLPPVAITPAKPAATAREVICDTLNGYLDGLKAISDKADALKLTHNERMAMATARDKVGVAWDLFSSDPKPETAAA